MRCDEVWEMLERAGGMANMTRGERAMVVGHVNGCAECNSMVNDAVVAMGPEQLRVAADTNAELAWQDTADPEFVATVRQQSARTRGTA